MFSLSMCWAKVSPPGHLFMARTEADKQWTRLKGDASSSWNYTSARGGGGGRTTSFELLTTIILA